LVPLIKSIRLETGNRAETTQEWLLPSGQTSLWIILNRDKFHSSRGTAPGAFVYGPDDRASVVEIESGRAHVAVEFTPVGAAAFFALALSELCGGVAGLRDLWGQDGAELRERVLEARDKTRVVETRCCATCLVAPIPRSATPSAGSRPGSRWPTWPHGWACCHERSAVGSCPRSGSRPSGTHVSAGCSESYRPLTGARHRSGRSLRRNTAITIRRTSSTSSATSSA
jgi:hypothetical protein